MMKKVLYPLLILLFCFSLFAQQALRGTEWGMSRDEVRSIEKAEFYDENEEMLFYKDNLEGLDTFILYSFHQDKLVNGGYMFTEKHSNKNLHIDDFNKLKSLLSHKYGDPITDRINWSNDLFKNDTSQYGMAISVGHLSYYADWKAEGQSVRLFLNGDNYEITLAIRYESTELMREAYAAEKQAILDDLLICFFSQLPHCCQTCAHGAAGLRDFEITCLLDRVSRANHCGCEKWSDKECQLRDADKSSFTTDPEWSFHRIALHGGAI